MTITWFPPNSFVNGIYPFSTFLPRAVPPPTLLVNIYNKGPNLSINRGHNHHTSKSYIFVYNFSYRHFRKSSSYPSARFQQTNLLFS